MQLRTFNQKQARLLLPQRGSSQNKTHGGKTLIIAGQRGYFGAAVLAATAAARVGSGYTILMTDQKHFPIQKHPDFLILSKSKINQNWKLYHSIAVGPGLGINTKTEQIIHALIKNKIENVILDADALTVIARKNIHPLPKSWLLTPHTGELARLLKKQKITAAETLKSLQVAQKKYQCHILLKGPITFIINSKKVIQVKSGNSALAKAGTGDVLTGIIAGLVAQGLSVMEAAALGAFLHGFCSQIWVKGQRDHLSLLASDLLLLIPQGLATLRKKRRI